jgi:hypothetical protein|tara:strand:- start:1975 stop:2658 length:684 start_codon:yes stop_codon:yes gene_type:complete
MNVKDYGGLKPSENFYNRFEPRCNPNVYKELHDYAHDVDDWTPTKKYSFYHTTVPLPLIEKDPLLSFVYERFGETLPWILMMPGGTMFDTHTDPSKCCAVNMALSERHGVVTLFKHSSHERRHMSHIIPIDYGLPGQCTLINNMKPHTVINYSQQPALMFTIPCMLMKPDFEHIMSEYETLCDTSSNYTYREESGLANPAMNKVTPKHLEIMIYNKVLQILRGNGYA